MMTQPSPFAYQCLFSNLSHPDERRVNCASMWRLCDHDGCHLHIVVLKVAKTVFSSMWGCGNDHKKYILCLFFGTRNLNSWPDKSICKNGHCVC